MEWFLSIDFGTTTTVAAVTDSQTPNGRLVHVADGDRYPSALLVRPDCIVAGPEVLSVGRLEPFNVVHRPKAMMGAGLQRAGGRVVSDVELASAVIRVAYDEALRLYDGSPPAMSALTHPARWSQVRIDALAQAGDEAGLPNVHLLPEPVAAAGALLARDDSVASVTPGSNVVLFDWGGGTLDVTLLRRNQNSFDILGEPGGDEHLGGDDLDESLLQLVIDQLDEHDRSILDADPEDSYSVGAVRAYYALKLETRRAKEQLSRHPQWRVILPSPPLRAEHVTVTVTDLAQAAAEYLERAVVVLETVLTRNNLAFADINAIFLAGGTCRSPLIGRRLAAHVGGGNVHTWGDPKALTALGALEWLTSQESTSKSSYISIVPRPGFVSPQPASPESAKAGRELRLATIGGELSRKAGTGAPVRQPEKTVLRLPLGLAGEIESWSVQRGQTLAAGEPVARLLPDGNEHGSPITLTAPASGYTVVSHRALRTHLTSASTLMVIKRSDTSSTFAMPLSRENAAVLLFRLLDDDAWIQIDDGQYYLKGIDTVHPFWIAPGQHTIIPITTVHSRLALMRRRLGSNVDETVTLTMTAGQILAINIVHPVRKKRLNIASDDIKDLWKYVSTLDGASMRIVNDREPNV